MNVKKKIAPAVNAATRPHTTRLPFAPAAKSLLALAFVFLTAPLNWAAAPVLTPPANKTILEDAARTNLTYTVTDSDTPVFLVTVTASSSNTNLVADADLFLVGSGTSRTLGIIPSADASGTTTITLIADDGS